MELVGWLFPLYIYFVLAVYLMQSDSDFTVKMLLLLDVSSPSRPVLYLRASIKEDLINEGQQEIQVGDLCY